MTRRLILALAIAAAAALWMSGSGPGPRFVRGESGPPASAGRRPDLVREEPVPPENPFAAGGHGRLEVAVRSRRDGSPVPGARVEVAALADWGAARRVAIADESGEARFDRVPAGALRILAAGTARPWALESGDADRVEVAVDPGTAPGPASTKRAPAREAETPVVGGAAFVEGCARDEAGRPLARVIVTARAEESGIRLAQVATAGDGTYRLDGLPAAIVSLRAGFLAGEPVQGSVDLRSAGRAAWDPALVTGRVVSGVVSDEHGTPRPFAVVRAHSADGRAWTAETVADRAGRFEVANAAEGRLVVEIEPARWAEGNAWTVETAASGAVSLEVVVPESDRPSAFLSGRLVDATGAPRRGVLVSAVRAPRPSDRPAVALASEADGSFRIGPLAPGVWALETPARSATRALLAERVLAAGDEVDVGEVRAAGEGFMKMSLKRGPGAPRSQRIEVYDRLSRRVATLRPAADFAASGPLAPGAYELRVGGAGVAERELGFVVREGGTTTLEVVVEAGSGASR